MYLGTNEKTERVEEGEAGEAGLDRKSQASPATLGGVTLTQVFALPSCT